MKNRKRKSTQSNGKNPKGGALERSWMPCLTEKQLKIMVDQALNNPDFSLTENEARRQILMHVDQEKNTECWMNGIYQINVYRNQDANHMVHTEELKDKCGYISIKRRDKRPLNSWQDVQTIKNRLFGIEREAIQIFPAESRMVNLANQYHLFVMPEDFIIPFGFIDGRRIDKKPATGAINGSKGQVYKGEEL